MDSTIQLYYFRGRGRAEPIRIILNYLQLPYENIFIDTYEAMKTLHDRKLSPSKQIPILHIDDQYLVQTPAIFRYLARKHNLYGNNDIEKYHCDMLTAAALDWQANYFKAVFNSTFAIDYKNSVLAKHLAIFETLLENGRSIYFVNNKPTFADLFIFELLLNQMDMFNDTLQPYPKLTEFYAALNAIPQLKKYLNSEERLPFPSAENGYVQTVHRVLGRT